MGGDVDYKAMALEAVEGMRPDSLRELHSYDKMVSPIRLVDAISRLPQVVTARLTTHDFNHFSIAIETNSTNC